MEGEAVPACDTDLHLQTFRANYISIDELKRCFVELRKNGFVVINLPFLVSSVKTLRTQFEETLVGFPEFARSDDRPSLNSVGKPLQYVLGGFAALGNPASFHNLFVRRMRQWLTSALMPLFQHLGSLNRLEKLEVLFDRMLYRLPGESPSAETWHRDLSPGFEDDIVFGGWLNLDVEKSQSFSCVPGTYADPVVDKKGFATFSKEDVHTMRLKERSSKVIIPPGHILLFDQRTIHEVVAGKLAYTTARLFVGWRLTNHSNSMQKHLHSRLKHQAVMELKSGQMPPMWAKLHWTNWVDKLEAWSMASFHPRTLERERIKSGAKRGREVVRVHREMKSLKEYNPEWMYPEYSHHEEKLYSPNSCLRMLCPGSLDTLCTFNMKSFREIIVYV